MSFSALRISIPSEKLNNLLKIDISKFYLFRKESVAEGCFSAGLLIAYLGSLHPWFLWILQEYYVIPASGLMFIGYLISNSTDNSFFKREKYVLAFILYFVLAYYIIIVGEQNFNSYIYNIFPLVIFFVLLKANANLLDRTVTWLSKLMAIMLIPSMFFFILYLMGFSLPCQHVVFNQYSYSNYYFFMISDGLEPGVIIPRFHSVFLEPGHMGSATCLLLMTQMGKWKRWWNVVLLVASIISFSLAAYALLIALIFLNLWVQRKQIIKKVLLSITCIAAVVTIATFYNKGDNMVNTLILARLEIDESTGQIVGNNRVSKDFEKEFEEYIQTSDAFFGRDMEKFPKGSGNSGYRVFIYQNGFVGLLLVILFYGFSFRTYRDYRHLISVIIISLLIFWIRGYPLWYSNFIPLLATALQSRADSKTVLI